MNSAQSMMIYGVLLIGAGFGVQWIDSPEFQTSGKYMAAAGFVAVAFGLWFHLRGGDEPHPLPGVEPDSVAKGDASRCTQCGSSMIRPLSAHETTDFYGYDAFVLVRPKVCTQCGHRFEPMLGRFGKSVMISIGLLGVLVGLVLIAMGCFGIYMLVYSAEVEIIRWSIGIVAILGAGGWWVQRCWKIVARNW